ncbi:MAG: M14 family zinc carboxypeptidase [Acidobacteriota bacterium]
MSLLDIQAILDPSRSASPEGSIRLASSREGRDVSGHRFGSGRRSISLIAGCHADEPVGPATLDRLGSWLEGLDPDHPLLRRYRWHLVPHVNPDGEARNAPWTDLLGDPATWPRRKDPVTVDLLAYLHHVARELPGDDVEFGFPRGEDDAGARPENRGVADFLRPGGPYALHGSFHGMGFAAGPWFLIEADWADRTGPMRDELRSSVEAAGYTVHDVDRGGEKGFTRIDRGFTTRPDSRAMAAHFEALGSAEMAALFRPSSMEMVRSFGGDPLTLVSEMPLFLLPADEYAGGELVRPAAVQELRRVSLARNAAELDRSARRLGLRPMPLCDQMRFQLEFLDAALRAVEAAA